MSILLHTEARMWKLLKNSVLSLENPPIQPRSTKSWVLGANCHGLWGVPYQGRRKVWKSWVGGGVNWCSGHTLPPCLRKGQKLSPPSAPTALRTAWTALHWSKFISLIKYLSMFSGHVWPFISIASDYDGRGACLRLFLRSHAETQKEFHGGRSSHD